MLLNKIQAIIYLEISRINKPIHIYELRKIINKNGYDYSHQQFYKNVAKMNLDCKVEKLIGKPDRKLYSINNKIEYKFDYSKLDVKFCINYGEIDLLEDKLEELCKLIDDSKCEYDKAHFEIDAEFISKRIFELRKKTKMVV